MLQTFSLRIFSLRCLVATTLVTCLASMPLKALADLTVGESATAYIQWLSSASDPMTDADGGASIPFTPYLGGASVQMLSAPSKDFYIGIMCNRTAGYTVTLTSTTAGATSTTAKFTIAGGSEIVYTAAISKEAGTFSAGANTSHSINLTGSTPSITVSFATESDLPLSATAPNVWKISASVPDITNVADGLVMAGSYQGGITAVVSLR